ncbi:MAG: hypothetical protein QOJ72_425, partial [Nocardioidaceae bacterium]|nr:hypothetical protein [Nocardioidaceae bacterium]
MSEQSLTEVGRLAIGVATAAAQAALELAVGWDRHPLALFIAAEALIQLPLTICGAAAVRAAQRNVVGWLLLLGGVFIPIAIAAFLYGRAAFDHGHDLPLAHLVAWLDGWPWIPAQLSLALFAPLYFPDGRLPSPRWRVVVALDLAVSAVLLISTIGATGLLDWPDEANPTALPGRAGEVAEGLMGFIVLVAPLTLAGLVGFEQKCRRTRDTAAAAAMRRVRPAVWLFAVAWWGCLGLAVAGQPTLYSLPVESLGMVATGITCWVAIRRYQLFDARIVLRRSVVYVGLSVAVLATYAAVTVALSSLGARAAATPVAVLAAVLLAVPLQSRFQQLANRLVYGTRDDPVATLLRLGDQLERAVAADEVIPAAVRSLQETLRLQHVAILTQGAVVAEAGERAPGRSEEVPLIYAGEQVGAMIVTFGDDDKPLDGERWALLANIARPVAAALRATSLGRDLALSHERLVEATEEERRRLRRDLHDGLGPTLASAVLGISRAHALLVTRPEAAAAQLELLTSQVQQAVTDVRRLVYDLRPPALDHLGLVGALTEHAESLGTFTVQGPANVSVSAATEVAAYRIAMEAMTNSVRHGQATRGQVDIRVADGIE